MPADKLWHVTRDNKQYGPFSTAQLQAMAAKGNLVSTDFVRAVGTDSWVAVGDCEDFIATRFSLSTTNQSSRFTTTDATSSDAALLPKFHAASKTKSKSPSAKTGGNHRYAQWLPYLGSASVAGLLCFAIGFIAANGFSGGKKQRASAKVQAQAAEMSPSANLSPAILLRRFQSVPDVKRGRRLSKMPKELQGQWVSEWISGDQGETFTRPADRTRPRFLMFESAWCFGSSELSDSEDLQPYVTLVQLPEVEGEPAWAIELLEGTRFIMHGSSDRSLFVFQEFEGESPGDQASWRSLTRIKPHTEEARRFAAGTRKSAGNSSSESQSAVPPTKRHESVPSVSQRKTDRRSGTDLRNCSWGDSLAVVRDTAIEHLEEADGVGSRDRHLTGNADLNGEDMIVTYKFFDNQLVGVSLAAYYKRGMDGLTRTDSWNPYSAMASIGSLLFEKYGNWTDQQAQQDGRKLGLLQRKDWMTYMPRGHTSATEIWDLPRHTVKLIGTRYLVPNDDFRSCILEYDAKSPLAVEYRDYLARASAQKSEEGRSKRLKQAEGL
jgi:hypothetical protein